MAVVKFTVKPQDLEGIFNDALGARHNTVLVGGAAEPLYQPATARLPARILYRRDYLRSALHEVAHWCLAGPLRRQLPDYGYWYSADGRDAEQQAAFFCVEARPQALENLFCNALAVPFSISVDNPGVVLEQGVLAHFQDRLHMELTRFSAQGLPGRALRFLRALDNH